MSTVTDIDGALLLTGAVAIALDTWPVSVLWLLAAMLLMILDLVAPLDDPASIERIGGAA